MSSLPPIFPLKIHLALLRHLDAGKSFLPHSHHGTGRFQRSERLSFLISSTEHLSCRHPKLSTLSLDPQVLRASSARKLNGAPLLFVRWPSSSDHPLAQNLPACIFPGQEPFDMRRLRFSPNFPNPPTHTNTPFSERTSFDPFQSVSTSASRRAESLYPSPYILGGRVSPSNHFHASSSTTTATSLPHVKLVGGFPDPIDPGASTGALPLCPKGIENPTLRAMILIILLHSVDDYLRKAERKAAMDTNGETGMRSQEVLEWFLRVQGNNVEACCSGQGSMASGTQRGRIGVEGKLEA